MCERGGERDVQPTALSISHKIVLGNINPLPLPGGAVAVCLICPGCACVIVIFVLKKKII